jgi:hypothetical protein
MLKKLIGTIAVAVIIAAPARQAAAQLAKGYTDIGGVVGVGGTGEAGLAFGGRFERVIKDLPSMGGGTLGIGVSVDYWGYDYLSYYSYTYMPIGVTGNYHVKLENKKIDVFGGAGLGYNIISCSYSGPGGSLGDLCEDGSIYVIVRAGGRYFFKPNLALYGDVGVGASSLNIGLTFKLR